jgi:hypothetical protein
MVVGWPTLVKQVNPVVRQPISHKSRFLILIGRLWLIRYMRKQFLRSSVSFSDRATNVIRLHFRILPHFGHSGLDPESIACTNYGFRIKPGMTVVS